MTIEQAQWLAGGLVSYGVVGLVFALVFVAWGVDRIDSAASGMPWLARLLLIPGATALWPLMLAKWLRPPAPPST